MNYTPKPPFEFKNKREREKVRDYKEERNVFSWVFKRDRNNEAETQGRLFQMSGASEEEDCVEWERRGQDWREWDSIDLLQMAAQVVAGLLLADWGKGNSTQYLSGQV